MHVEQIKAALGVAGVASENSALVTRGGDSGMQIDLVISRADNVVKVQWCLFERGRDGGPLRLRTRAGTSLLRGGGWPRDEFRQRSALFLARMSEKSQ